MGDTYLGYEWLLPTLCFSLAGTKIRYRSLREADEPKAVESKTKLKKITARAGKVRIARSPAVLKDMALRAFKQPAARLTGALALFRNCCRNVTDRCPMPRRHLS